MYTVILRSRRCRAQLQRRPAHRSELALSAAYDGLQSVSIEEGVLAGAARDAIVVTLPVEVGWKDLSL